jgi:hypothetical protein
MDGLIDRNGRHPGMVAGRSGRWEGVIRPMQASIDRIGIDDAVDEAAAQLEGPRNVRRRGRAGPCHSGTCHNYTLLRLDDAP